MTVKELKQALNNLPDEAKIYIDFEYHSEEYNWDREEASVVNLKFLQAFNEFHLCGYE